MRVRTPWTDADAFMFADRLLEFLDSDPAPTGVSLLAHEDTALKAYFQTRTRYLGNLPAARAFNQIGEALPTVMINGKIAGTWQWNAAQRAVALSLVPGRLDTHQRRAANQAADQLTAVLWRAWSTTTPPSDDHGGRQLLLTGTGE